MADLSELNRKTLASYVKKAKDSYGMHAADYGKSIGTNDTPRGSRSFRLAVKRGVGIDRAADRLAKEETEVDIQELSKTLLGRYINNAAVSAATEHGQRINAKRNREAADNMTNTNHLHPKLKDKIRTLVHDHERDSENKHMHKVAVRIMGIERATKRLTKENAEVSDQNQESITARDLVRASLAGDPIAFEEIFGELMVRRQAEVCDQLRLEVAGGLFGAQPEVQDEGDVEADELMTAVAEMTEEEFSTFVESLTEEEREEFQAVLETYVPVEETDENPQE